MKVSSYSKFILFFFRWTFGFYWKSILITSFSIESSSIQVAFIPCEYPLDSRTIILFWAARKPQVVGRKCDSLDMCGVRKPSKCYLTHNTHYALSAKIYRFHWIPTRFRHAFPKRSYAWRSIFRPIESEINTFESLDYQLIHFQQPTVHNLHFY